MPGSLIKKGDNKWELRVSLGYDKDTKKQIRKTKLVHGDRKTAEKLLAQFYLETIDSPAETKKYKFSEFVECVWTSLHQRNHRSGYQQFFKFFQQPLHPSVRVQKERRGTQNKYCERLCEVPAFVV